LPCMVKQRTGNRRRDVRRQKRTLQEEKGDDVKDEI